MKLVAVGGGGLTASVNVVTLRDMSTDLLTTRDVADLADCSNSTVRRWSTAPWSPGTASERWLECKWWNAERPPGWDCDFSGRTYTRAEACRWIAYRDSLAHERYLRDVDRAERKRHRTARCDCCTVRQARNGCLTVRAKRLQEHILAQPEEVKQRWKEHGWLAR